MIEWGLTYEEFNSQPDIVIRKIKEGRQARISGENRRANKPK